ncbi:MAG: carboxymuconolactone decarboxylase family protein [Alphaproteobacteria bacterium]|nr:carboxymuconolactone decarboxylase family protein [Alphaproteobacteria bacterium]
MSIESIRGVLPPFARDLKLNLSAVLSGNELTPAQRWGAALAAAVASRNAELVAAVEADAAPHLDAAGREAARGAAALMAMNNVYYRFTHLVGDADYGQMPARLRMTVIGNPGVPHLDFELWSLGVSAINGCGMCMAAHARAVTEKGGSKEAVQAAVRIAAVVAATAVALDEARRLEGGLPVAA